MRFDISKVYGRLYRFCYFRLRNKEVAQDIVQESFVRYIDRYGAVNGKSVPVLYTIARNLCIDHVRRYSDTPGCDPFSLQDLPVGGDLAENLIERLSVQRALSRMPLSETEILLLVIVDGLSIQDAGRIVGISRFAVYRRLQSGKKHLKEELMKEGAGELSVRMRGGA